MSSIDPKTVTTRTGQEFTLRTAQAEELVALFQGTAYVKDEPFPPE